MKFIIILIAIFLLLRLILKPILKLVIQTVLSRMAKQGGGFQRTYTFNNAKKKPEGTIEVDPEPKTKYRNPNNNNGEYIDYEVVK